MLSTFLVVHSPLNFGGSGTGSLSGHLHALFPSASLVSLHVISSMAIVDAAARSFVSSSRWSPILFFFLMTPNAMSAALDRKMFEVLGKTYTMSFAMTAALAPFFFLYLPVIVAKKLPMGWTFSPDILLRPCLTGSSLSMSIPSSSACFLPIAVTWVPVSITHVYSLTGLILASPVGSVMPVFLWVSPSTQTSTLMVSCPMFPSIQSSSSASQCLSVGLMGCPAAASSSDAPLSTLMLHASLLLSILFVTLASILSICMRLLCSFCSTKIALFIPLRACISHGTCSVTTSSISS